MELTDKQKHDLRRFSLILNSLNMEDGVEWTYRHYDEWESDYPDGPYYRNRNVKNETVKKVKTIITINFHT